MKKIIMVALWLLLILSLVGCGTKLNIGKESSIKEGSSLDVTMQVIKGTISLTSLKLCVKNNTDIEILSGNEFDFLLEVYQQGKWFTINTKERENTAEALGFMGERELEISWENIYGLLPTGHYRIVKYFFPYSGYKDGFYLTSEFDIE